MLALLLALLGTAEAHEVRVTLTVGDRSLVQTLDVDADGHQSAVRESPFKGRRELGMRVEVDRAPTEEGALRYAVQVYARTRDGESLLAQPTLEMGRDEPGEFAVGGAGTSVEIAFTP